MRINPFATFIASALLALNTTAQEGPIRVLPAPQAAPAPDVPPGVEFPIDPEMPDEGWAEPGMPHEMMMMPPMPGRFKIITVQLPQGGKFTPYVLKLDTQTGQTWQLKLLETTFRHNGKPQIRTRLTFQPVDGGVAPNHGHGFVPGHPGIGGETVPGQPDVIEGVPTIPIEPDEPREDRPVPAIPVRPRTIPQPAPAPAPREN